MERPDLRGRVARRVPVQLQGFVGADVGLTADVPAVGPGAAHHHPVVEGCPAKVLGEDLLGHRGAADVSGAHERHVQRGCQAAASSIFRGGRRSAPSCARARPRPGIRSPTRRTPRGMPPVRGTEDVVVTVATIRTSGGGALGGGDSQVPEGVGDHVRLGAPTAVVAGAADELEVVGQFEVFEDADREPLGLGRGDGEPSAAVAGIDEDLLDAVEDGVLRPPPRCRSARSRPRSPAERRLRPAPSTGTCRSSAGR